MQELCDWRRGLLPEIEERLAEGFDPPETIKSANPLGLSADQPRIFRGQIGQTPSGLIKFLEPAYGIRAGAIVVGMLVQHARCNTPSMLIQTLKPFDFLTHDHAIKYVCGIMGVARDATIDLDIQGRVLARALIGYHSGMLFKGRRVDTYYDPQYLRTAIASSHII